jgi:hypothetical protein
LEFHHTKIQRWKVIEPVLDREVTIAIAVEKLAENNP